MLQEHYFNVHSTRSIICYLLLELCAFKYDPRAYLTLILPDYTCRCSRTILSRTSWSWSSCQGQHLKKLIAMGPRLILVKILNKIQGITYQSVGPYCFLICPTVSIKIIQDLIIFGLKMENFCMLYSHFFKKKKFSSPLPTHTHTSTHKSWCWAATASLPQYHGKMVSVLGPHPLFLSRFVWICVYKWKLIKYINISIIYHVFVYFIGVVSILA